jgi:AraC-like DNA-binding protein
MRPVAIERARTRRTVVHEVQCRLGRHDRPYPERHGGWCVALVRRGAFTYRAADAARSEELREGWLLLGRDGCEFECSHRTDGGDDCLSVRVDAAMLDDVRASSRNGGRHLFPRSVLPPVPRISALFAAAERSRRAAAPIDADALSLAVVEAALQAAGAEVKRARSLSVRDRDNVAAALAAIDARPEATWALGDLAALVDASPFHFARAFRDVVGTSPHRYVVTARLRRALALLLDTKRSVTDVAFDVGFGDLSNFIHTFRRDVGVTPSAFRAGRS